MRNTLKLTFLLLAASLLLLLLVLLAGCVNAPDQGGGGGANRSGKIRIGLSMDTLKEERWQRDRELFVKAAEALGAEVLVQAANGDDRLQTQQAENLLTQGVNVLVVVPHNGEVAASIVDSAKRQNVPVISYDRLIRNSDVDLYLSYDNVRVGEMQAKYLLDHQPKGNYILIGGAPTDNNARLLREGQKKVLQPVIDRGDVKIVADQWAKEWQASEALKHTENALTQNNNNVQAVLVSNDGTAGGVIQALEKQSLVGKVWVTGMDADLPALQRIVEGKQSMTIYKPIAPLAQRAAEAAVALAKGEKVQTTQVVNNGKKDVPSILLEPIAVDKQNLAGTIIKDGFHTVDEVYKNVPKDQWPKPATAGDERREAREQIARATRTPGTERGLLFSVFSLILLVL
ncbi:MAG TPA: D-xylose ABC transporter substrate-binding protein [Pyrinomonadaceae bacterium]|jgi:D-xylose transport system substrate-binding protein|nr:D-xylose ABC transporter substrate-binding protein [Pyrinomonadaceae bacterium]